jgi:hypothetical protein
VAKPRASHIGTGWEDQWNRVQRWNNRVRAIAVGAPTGGVLPHPDAAGDGDFAYQAWALDLVFAFFMNCYHLRDWFIESGHSTRAQIDAHIEVSDSLLWCRDICNGMKHFRLDPAKPTTTYESWSTASLQLSVSGLADKRPQPVAGHYWYFIDQATGDQRDMFELADDCVKDWAAFLKARSEAAHDA